MESSILNTIKKMLGLTADYTAFDTDIVVHINTVLMGLTQLGVGPSTGFFINGVSETWKEFLGSDSTLASVKSYVYLKVRLLFDPPATSFVIDAIQNSISELEWRLTVEVETPSNPIVTEGGVV